MRTILTLLGVALSLIAPAPAHAQPNPDKGCAFGGKATWDAPNGYLVTSQSDDVVRAITAAIGEQATHSALSHGGWVTTNTSALPAHNAGCSPPANVLDVNQLRYGNPGAVQINSGGIFSYYYGVIPTSLGGKGRPGWINKQRGTAIADANGVQYAAGTAVADNLWNNVAYQWHALPDYDGAGPESWGYYDIGGWIAAPQPQPNVFKKMNYSLYQYRTIQGINAGGYTSWYSERNSGSICATSIAWSHAWGRRNVTNPWPVDITTHTIPAGSIGQAGTYQFAVEQTRSAIMNNCLGNVPDTGILGSLFCSSAGSQACFNATMQVMWCFTQGQCDRGGDGSGRTVTDPWYGNYFYRNYLSPGDTATTISPETLAGYRPGQDWGNDNAGPWSQNDYEPVNFSGNGSVAGCWKAQ